MMKMHSAVLGSIQDFFYRVEFQHRGSPHIHMLVWVGEAPKYGISTSDSLVDYTFALLQLSNA